MEKALLRILIFCTILFNTQLFAQDTLLYAGYVKYSNDVPLSDVNINLHNLQGEILFTTISDNSGYYVFNNLSAGNYLITLSTDQPPGGVELSDAYLIDQYLAGNDTLSSIQLRAADVNGNGVINGGDSQRIVNFINNGTPFPIGGWVFQTDTITVTTDGGDGTTRLGNSSGDVNGSLQPDPKRNRIEVNSPAVIAHDSPEGIAYQVTPSQLIEISGMHLAFRIPEGVSVTEVETPFPGFLTHFDGNILKITWIDYEFKGHWVESNTSLVSIRVKTSQTNRTGEQIQLVLCDESHFMDASGNLLTGKSLSLPAITVVNSDQVSAKAYPNPFVSEFTIGVSLTEGKDVQVVLMDQTGRQVMVSNNEYFDAGSHSVNFNADLLPQGTYYYQIRLNGQLAPQLTGSLIKSK